MRKSPFTPFKLGLFLMALTLVAASGCFWGGPGYGRGRGYGHGGYGDGDFHDRR